MHAICKALTTLMFCPVVSVAAAQGQEWYTYRHDSQRTGVQPFASSLSDPNKVGALSVKWSFPLGGQPPVGSFKASPIVANDTVFIGDENGYFYALDAATGRLRWQYPKAGEPPLFDKNGSPAYGIHSSAAFWNRGPNGAVIFAAQDPSLGPFRPDGKPYGSARLFALDAKLGTVIWKSDPVATINGECSSSNPNCHTSNTELHQIIHYSPPLVFDNKVYVGIQGDEYPIQIGRVVAIDLASGHKVPTFQFQAVGTPASPLGTVRGGDVWNAPATDGTGIYFTTGNTNIDNGNPPQTTEPSPNHGLSMIRVDKNTGSIAWAFQPVPFKLDDDPDWAAGAAVMSTSCGKQIVSVQKDGWSYAVDAATGSCNWQFPPVTPPIADPSSLPCKWTGYSKFNPAVGSPWNHKHPGDGYKGPGAAWNDVFIVGTAGEALTVPDDLSVGYGKLHALNACATTETDRVRWIRDIPDNGGGLDSLGVPTVSGGIVFIGTDQGHLVVLGDPIVVFADGLRCSNVEFTSPPSCTSAGYAIVPIPRILANVAMPDGGNIGYFRKEAALAKGRVFVATKSGHVYMLDTAVENKLAECLAFCRETTSQCLAGCFPNPPHSGCAPPGRCAKIGEDCQASCRR